MKLTEAKLKKLIREQLEDELVNHASKLEKLLSGDAEDRNQGVELLMTIIEMFPNANKSPAMKKVAMKHYKEIIKDREFSAGSLEFMSSPEYKQDLIKKSSMSNPTNDALVHGEKTTALLNLDALDKTIDMLTKEVEEYDKIIQVFIDNFFFE